MEAQAARGLGECCAVQELFTGHVVGANMDEGGSQTLTVKQTVKECRGFSIVRGRLAEVAASAVSDALMEKNISPSRGTCRRVLSNDSRAVSDKHGVK